MKSKKTYKIFLLTLAVLFIACNNNRLDVDISHIEAELSVKRFEQDLFAADPDSMIKYNAKSYAEYGEFYQRYVEQVLNLGPVEDSALGLGLKDFVQNADVREIYNASNRQHADLSLEIDKLTTAFRYYRYYFPNAIIPEIVTFISGFNYSFITLQNTLGVGLDMYLGNDFEHYPGLGFPQYKTRKMTRNYIAVDAMKGWLMSEFEPEKPPHTMLDVIIQEGKLLYLLDAMMPGIPDSLKIGFTADQLEWCKNNEFNMWAHFVDEKLFYSSDFGDIRQYTGEGPFTKGFPEGSPAQTGLWIGRQIVRSFMDKHREITLSELMQMRDAQKILSKSGYKPK